MVLCCTFLGAASQTLIKMGASNLGSEAGLLDAALGILTNPYLFAGYALYGLFTVVLVLALRHGELSLLYPVIALTYVWVSIISVVKFHEPMNPWKMAGVVVIVTGVGILGKGQRRLA